MAFNLTRNKITLNIKRIFLILFLIKATVQIEAQERFNLRQDLGLPVSIYTSVLTVDSGYYLTGISVDSITTRTTSLIVFVDTLGNPEILNTLHHPNRQYAAWEVELLPLSNGGFIHSSPVVDYDMGEQYIQLIKYNEHGDTLFTKNYYDLDVNQNYYKAQDIIEMDNGDYIILSEMDFTGFNVDLTLMRTDSLGNEKWQYLHGSSIDEHVRCIFQDNTPDKGFIIGSSKDNLRHTNLPNTQAYLVKMDSTGANIVWEWWSPVNILVGPIEDVVKTPDGGYLCASSYGEQQYNGAGPTDVWFQPYLFKLDVNRNLLWEIKLNVPHGFNSNYKKIIPLTDGNYIVGGTHFFEDESQHYGLLTKVCPNGTIEWERKYKHLDVPSEQHLIYDMDTTADGGFILCGQSMNFLNDPVSNPIPQQAWLIKTDEYGCTVPGCQNVSIEEIQKEQLSVYPNPAGNTLNIYIPQANNNTSLSLYNAQGQLIQTHPIHRNNLSLIWNVSHLPNGIYFLKLQEQNNTITTEKIIISR